MEAEEVVPLTVTVWAGESPSQLTEHAISWVSAAVRSLMISCACPASMSVLTSTLEVSPSGGIVGCKCVGNIVILANNYEKYISTFSESQHFNSCTMKSCYLFSYNESC